MRPKKAKDFIPEVATATSLSEEAVKDIITAYYSEVRKSLSNLEHCRIHLTNLGDFVIKHWKIDDKIEMLEKWEENNRLKGLQQITARFKTAESLYNLKSIKKVVEEEMQRKDFIKLHKNKTHEPKEKPDNNLEEQGTDSGGNS